MGGFLRPPMLGPRSFASPALTELSLHGIDFSKYIVIPSIKEVLIIFLHPHQFSLSKA